MKSIFLVFVMAALFYVPASAQNQESFYDFQVPDIDGNTFNMESLRGKKVLVVNTASKCGNTPQYADLEKLYQEYGSKGFVVIGFPANDFRGQEPGTNEEIKEFCQLNYGVTFPMMSKISVVKPDMHPLYKWLTSKELNGFMDSEVTWNFQKYMINESGHLIDMVEPSTKPYTDKIINWLNN